MTAPALVALAHGSRDPRSAATITALVDEVRAMRPDLRIEQAFLELSKPSFATVVDRLVKAGHDEIVVVPLLLTEAYHAKVDVPSAIAEATGPAPGPEDPGDLHPRPRAVLPRGARPSGCATPCKTARVRELDALVLAAAGSSDPLANQAVARLARVWGQRHKLPVTAAFASAAPPADRRGGAPVPGRGPPPHRRRLAVPRAGLPARPGRRARPARPAPIAVSEPLGCAPRAGPDHPGPLRRRRGRAGPRLTPQAAQLYPQPGTTAPPRPVPRVQLRRLGLGDQLAEQVVELRGRGRW